MNQGELKDKLIKRGTPLNKGFARDSNLVFTTFFQRRMPNDLVESHLSFDGFSAPDPHNYINMWSIERILFETMNILPNDSEFIVIGDFLMNSDFYICSSSNPNGPITQFYEKCSVATSYKDFWWKFLDGDFDLDKRAA